MIALVTGGGGFLGQAIVRRLLQRGIETRSFSRTEHAALKELGVEQCLGDIADSKAVGLAVRGCDLIFHAAAKPGLWGRYEDYHRTNVVGTKNLIDACLQLGVPRLIYTSSPSVVFGGKDMEGVDESVPYPSHYEAHYPRTKALAEQLVLASNGDRFATTSLRPHLIWGPGDNHLLPRLVSRARSGQLRRIGSRPNLIDAVYVDNAAEAHMNAADRLEPRSPPAGKAYFISQGEPVPMWEMVNRLLEAADAPLVKKSVPTWLAMAFAVCFEIAHRLTQNPAEPRLTRFVVREMSTAHWFNLEAARRDLGYNPKISIAEGLAKLRAAIKLESANQAADES